MASEAPCRGRQPAVSQAQLPCRSARAAPCRRPARIRPLPRPTPASPTRPLARASAPAACAPSLLPRPAPACPSAVSWPAWPYRRRKAARLAGRVLGWLCCIATQPSFSSLSQSQYTFCIATPSFSALKPVSLQYNFFFLFLFSHNTNWAVALQNFCTKKKKNFVFFSL